MGGAPFLPVLGIGDIFFYFPGLCYWGKAVAESMLGVDLSVIFWYL